MRQLEQLAATAFGLIFVGLALTVVVETVGRKLFSMSLQGADELGGYCLAIGGSLAFSVALIRRAHIRIDILHDRLPRGARVVFNMLSVVALAVTALALLWMAWIAFQDSVRYLATVQSPWATPLRYPQGAWVAVLLVFALTALVKLVKLTGLLVTGRFDAADREFAPVGTKEELAEEVADLKSRGAPGAFQLDLNR